MRAKALGDEAALETAVSFLVKNFKSCMRPAADGSNGMDLEEDEAVPACLADDDSPAVDLIMAVAKRYSQRVGISSKAGEPSTR